MSDAKSFPTPPTARVVLPDAPFIPRTFPAETSNVEDEESGARKRRQNGFETSTLKPTHCDGVDEICCFQVASSNSLMRKHQS